MFVSLLGTISMSQNKRGDLAMLSAFAMPTNIREWWFFKVDTHFEHVSQFETSKKGFERIVYLT